jgi:heat shock protein HtpX
MYQQIARNKRRSVLYLAMFLVAWLGIGALIGWLLAITSGSSADGSTRGYGYLITGLGVAGLLATAGIVFTLTSGSHLVLAVAGARLADPRRYPQLYHLVEALALGDGLPMPAVYVIDDPSPNAFATGISPDRAAVTVTSGLLAVMDREELEGVLAHEMSHIKNYDTRLLLVVTTLIGMAGLLASMIWRSSFLIRGRGRSQDQLTLVVLAGGLLLAVIGFIVGPIIRFAVSRQRESLADASGVELTRNPEGLIRALRRLQANDIPLARVNHVTSAMCIDDPLQHHAGQMHRLFDTHPPLAERIAALERIAAGQSV